LRQRFVENNLTSRLDRPASFQLAPEPEPAEEIAPVSTGFAVGGPSEGGEYAPLKLEDDEEGTELCRGKCSDKMREWHDEWLHSVECGELDIYTCLGLSNAHSWTEDTRKLIGKVLGVCVLQMVVPCILLDVELSRGFTLQPTVSGMGFRLMGASLYLYSLYNMYNNALDQCRSSLLQWAVDQNVPSGYWSPMMVGELTNVFVSLILVLTLFVIFVATEHPADLILNAVAVNFLGAVDGEFVTDDMKQDALRNFKSLFYEWGSDQDDQKRKEHTFLHTFLNVMLFIIVISGLCLSIVFLVAPSPSPEKSEHGGPTYPKIL